MFVHMYRNRKVIILISTYTFSSLAGEGLGTFPDCPIAGILCRHFPHVIRHQRRPYLHTDSLGNTNLYQGWSRSSDSHPSQPCQCYVSGCFFPSLSFNFDNMSLELPNLSHACWSRWKRRCKHFSCVFGNKLVHFVHACRVKLDLISNEKGKEKGFAVSNYTYPCKPSHLDTLSSCHSESYRFYSSGTQKRQEVLECYRTKVYDEKGANLARCHRVKHTYLLGTTILSSSAVKS